MTTGLTSAADLRRGDAIIWRTSRYVVEEVRRDGGCVRLHLFGEAQWLHMPADHDVRLAE